MGFGKEALMYWEEGLKGFGKKALIYWGEDSSKMGLFSKSQYVCVI